MAQVWYADGVQLQHTPWEGRHALGLPAEEIKALHARPAFAPWCIFIS